jgi:hypothetical protein
VGSGSTPGYGRYGKFPRGPWAGVVRRAGIAVARMPQPSLVWPTGLRPIDRQETFKKPSSLAAGGRPRIPEALLCGAPRPGTHPGRKRINPMKRIAARYFTLLGCAIVLCASLATDASAQATTVPIAGRGVITALLSPGTITIDDDGIEHVRNRVLEVTFFPFNGDLVGVQIVTGNSEVDLATGEGRSHGVLSFSGIHVPSGTAGTFEGVFTGDISPDSTFCGNKTNVRAFGHQGGGGFAGMKRSFVGTVTCPFFPVFFADYEGQILDPSGTLQP